ncbi:aminotransferase class V-fold PLP-dependent enzyme [Hugenholtzia roseola]|uniref:aminotransferase class V-fold PLP-dependent enzyme n=1 Tax=Hugenholtzia roseola TaxID=1002 RepID=UPI000417FCE7|nr:aminotransferase class V-fold PLP-dependent enzyme [Hugenholtzia roseola]
MAASALDFNFALSFAPGPTKIYPQMGSYYALGLEKGVFSLPHRSPEFCAIVAEAQSLLHQKLAIPADYQVAFLSSANECWDTLNRTFGGARFLHLFNGAFGEKWFRFRRHFNPNQTQGFDFELDTTLQTVEMLLDTPTSAQTEVFCLVEGETSNGSLLNPAFLSDLRQKSPKALLCIDATSTMAGIELAWQNGDIWFASVQKCFGQPAGLAVLVLSPFAQEKIKEAAQKTQEPTFYNSLPNVLRNIEKSQTTHTPNMVALFLLAQTLKNLPDIAQTAAFLEKRNQFLRASLAQRGYQTALFQPPKNAEGQYFALPAPTVLACPYPSEKLGDLKEKALAQGLRLGGGYGKWKDTSFRIANFPQHTDQDYEKLLAFLESYRG